MEILFDQALVAARRERAFRNAEPGASFLLDLVAHGLPNAAIAARLFLSEKTVRNRVSDVLTKLHAASRAEAVALARDAGLGPA